MFRVPRALVPGLAALAIGIPVGFAAAQATDAPSDFGRVAATKCPAAAQAVEAAGGHVDYFIPNCPTSGEVEKELAPAPIDSAIVDACRKALEVSAHPVCAAVIQTTAGKRG